MIMHKKLLYFVYDNNKIIDTGQHEKDSRNSKEKNLK